MPLKTSSPKKNLKRKRNPSSSTTPRTTRKKRIHSPTAEIIGPTSSSSSSSASASLTTLHPAICISHSLAQKIHNLILISRQIEAIWRGWFYGSRSDVKERLAQLEIHYDALRDTVSTELHAECLSAGQRPSDVLKGLLCFPPTHRVPESVSVKPKIPQRGVFDLEYSVDKELRDMKERGERQDQINWSSDEEEEEKEEEEVKFEVLQPIGVMRAQIPLTKGEKERMGKFSWRRKNAKAGQEDVCISPKGTELVFC